MNVALLMMPEEAVMTTTMMTETHKKETMDIAMVSGGLYNQRRARIVSAESAVDPGLS